MCHLLCGIAFIGHKIKASLRESSLPQILSFQQLFPGEPSARMNAGKRITSILGPESCTISKQILETLPVFSSEKNPTGKVAGSLCSEV